MYKKEFMEIAIGEARNGFLNGDGGAVWCGDCERRRGGGFGS